MVLKGGGARQGGRSERRSVVSAHLRVTRGRSPDKKKTHGGNRRLRQKGIGAEREPHVVKRKN